MLKNYIKVALRSLFRNKIYSAINIFGLAVGLAATILLFLYVRLELSYDKGFKDYENIYRVLSHSTRGGEQEIHMPITLYEIPDVVKTKIPEVESATRLNVFVDREVKLNNITKGFYKSALTDSSFCQVFSFKAYAGDLSTALQEPNSVVLTKESAGKIFGNAADAVGKTVHVYGTDMTVKAVMENVPANSHLKFDLLISINSEDENYMKYQGNNFFVYVKFNQPLTPAISTKTEQSVSEYVNDMFKEYKITYLHTLQPLKDIHLHAGDLRYENAEVGSIQYIYIFSVLAAFILIIAIFNYVNLFTSKSEARYKEVGIRKVSGASRRSLIRQFIGESVIIAFISFLIAMLLVESFLPGFSNLVSRKIDLSYANDYRLIIVFIVITILVGVMSGIYPAFYISKFSTSSILKGFFTGKKSKTLNVLLVVVQFSIAIALISALFVLYSQVNYMKNKKLGFDQEQIVSFSNFSNKILQNYESIKSELLTNPDIISVTASQSIPGYSRSGMTIRLPEWPAEEAIPIKENRVQDDYVKTMGFEIIKGSDFSDGLATDSSAFILNEAAVRLLNLEDPIGKEIIVWLHKGTIKGIIKDFHFSSLHNEIEPLVLSHYSNRFLRISIKLKAGRISQGLEYASSIFNKFDPDYTQNYNFLDEIFDNMYRSEEKSNKLILVASLLAIIISVLGLLALTSFIVARRTKEIGIRKALGSNVRLILILLNKDILKWVLVSSFIGIPASYFFMKNWLQNFAYKIDLNIWYFLGAILIALIIASITISVQSFKTASKNPTESLRYE